MNVLCKVYKKYSEKRATAIANIEIASSVARFDVMFGRITE